jgi:hypothetical protein
VEAIVAAAVGEEIDADARRIEYGRARDYNELGGSPEDDRREWRHNDNPRWRRHVNIDANADSIRRHWAYDYESYDRGECEHWHHIEEPPAH